jgi:hypothetical protein
MMYRAACRGNGRGHADPAVTSAGTAQGGLDEPYPANSRTGSPRTPGTTRNSALASGSSSAARPSRDVVMNSSSRPGPPKAQAVTSSRWPSLVYRRTAPSRLTATHTPPWASTVSPVGPTDVGRDLGEPTPSRQPGRGVVIELVDAVRLGVRAIRAAAVRTPVEPVGDRDAVEDHHHGEVGTEPVQGAVAVVAVIRHRPAVEPAIGSHPPSFIRRRSVIHSGSR